MSSLEEPIVFNCGEEELIGVIHRPIESFSTGVVIVVGGPQYRVGSHRQFLLLARYLANEGIPVMRFDYRGMGDSSGELRTFESVNEDIQSAIQKFQELVPEINNIILWGLCDAASAILFYAHTNFIVNGVILLNPWVHTEAGQAKAYLKNYYFSRIVDKNFWHKLFSGEVSFVDSFKSIVSLCRKAMVKTKNMDGGTASREGNNCGIAPLPVRMLDGLQAFTGKVLIILSGDDLTAGEFKNLVRSSRAWRKALKGPLVSTKHLDAANHTFSTREWRCEVEMWTARWVKGEPI